MAPTRREGRPARHAGVTIGWRLASGLASCNGRPRPRGALWLADVSPLEDRPGTWSSWRSRSGVLIWTMWPWGSMRKHDVRWLWTMIGSQRTCSKPSKQRPMCAYICC